MYRATLTRRPAFEVPKGVAEVARTPGISLDPAVQEDAGARLGFDFSRVKVHADSTAARSAEELGARAYAFGSDVAFGRGEYRPQTAEGAWLIRHELVHVAQQQHATRSTTARMANSQERGSSETEATALAGHPRFAPPPRISQTPLQIACFDPRGAELAQARTDALAHGTSQGDEVSQKEEQAIQSFVAPTRPGDFLQQDHTVRKVVPEELVELPRVQSKIAALATETEERERVAAGPRGKVAHTADKLEEYWKARFVASVRYILYERTFKDGKDRRSFKLSTLRSEEQKLIKANASDVVAQVESLRGRFKTDWQADIDRAVDRFLVLAGEQSKFLTRKPAAAVKVTSLPESVEGAPIGPTGHPELEKGASPVAPAVLEFVKAIRAETGMNVVAENYPRHELENVHVPVSDPKDVGKYSFDVHLDGLIATNAEGFYEREPTIRFFLAVDRAATTADVAWIALYNDFEVASAVNDRLGAEHIGFSGGGGPRGAIGQFHHGPAPYILHVHFNIMPKEKAEKFFETARALDRIFINLRDLLF